MPAIQIGYIRFMTRLSFLLLSLSLIIGLPLGAQKLSSTYQNSIQSFHFHSKILKEDRVLNFWVPSDYNDSISYQVVYVLDGSINEDFMHVAGLVQFFNLQFGFPPTIVVGIGNVDRKRDFTFEPTVEVYKDELPTSGGSHAFMKYLEEEVIPIVNNRFHTNDTSYLIGQSLGGLLATEVLLKHPHLFSHYLIVSPSMWWNDESLLHNAENLANKMKSTPAYVYIAVGKEGKVMQRGAKGIYRAIKSQDKAERLIFNKMKNENHASILHLAIYEGLQELYPRPE